MLAISVAVGPERFGSLQVLGQPHIEVPKFEVISIKPSLFSPSQRVPIALMSGVYGGACHGINTTNSSVPLGRCRFQAVTLKYLMFWAYSLQVPVTQVDQIITGGPDWIGKDRFQIEGVAPNPAETTLEQLALMLQDVLQKEFQLKFHYESTAVPGFVLMRAKSEERLKATDSGSETTPRISIAPGTTQITGRRATARMLADFLASRFSKPVVDRTELTGEYDFSFSATTTVDPVSPGNAVDADPAPSIFTALAELGLRLQPEKVARRLIVVEHAVKPLPKN